MIGGKILDQIKMDLLDRSTQKILTVYIDVFDTSLSRKWLTALNELLQGNYHLEKNFCFLGFVDAERNGDFILDQVNKSIQAINDAKLGYHIDDHFTLENCTAPGPAGYAKPGRRVIHDRMNRLHRYFEDTQGVSGRMSSVYLAADPITRWHIRQLNLLCHEFEAWCESWQKSAEPLQYQWQRPCQLMCWLGAPRFVLCEEDYEFFGIETINRILGGVILRLIKLVGKHHWEVFRDEGRDSRIGELTTSTLRSQTEAAGDFDIEWANDPAKFEWQQKTLNEFREWLTANGFDPEDKGLTIGHPVVAQVDLERSFGTDDYRQIWPILNKYLDVFKITTSGATAEYTYHWSDPDFVQRQVDIISKG